MAECGEEEPEKETIKNFCFEWTNVIRKSARDDVKCELHILMNWL